MSLSVPEAVHHLSLLFSRGVSFLVPSLEVIPSLRVSEKAKKHRATEGRNGEKRAGPSEKKTENLKLSRREEGSEGRREEGAADGRAPERRSGRGSILD